MVNILCVGYELSKEPQYIIHVYNYDALKDQGCYLHTMHMYKSIGKREEANNFKISRGAINFKTR